MKRQAILFSAGKYPSTKDVKIDELTGVSCDIVAMEKRLIQIGFDVIKKEEASMADYADVLKDYSEGLSADSISIIYFSGHGGHYNGKNYIIPSDFCLNFDATRDIDKSCVNIQDLISIFKNRGRLILILDACRKDILGSKGYFSEMASGENVYIAYGTMFEEVARGIPNDISLFTKAICDEILTPNIDVDTLFTKVRNNIFTKYGVQLPASVNTLLESIVLHEEIVHDDIDNKIYDFVKKYSAEYDKKYGYFRADDLIFIDAAQYFNISLLDAMWRWKKIDNKVYKEKGLKLPEISEAEQKIIWFLGFDRGEKYFTHDLSHTWYYNGRQIRMGEIPPLPESMKKKLPETGMEINVECDIIPDWDDEKLYIKLNTNLPDETPLTFTIKGVHYYSQSSGSVQNNGAISDGFVITNLTTDCNIFNVIITCPCYNVLPTSIQELFGRDNRNLIGKHIKFNPIYGNTLYVEQKFILGKDKSISQMN